jgi:hypothetical protein
MPTHKWGFLTNHAFVLLHVALNPRSTLRDIAYAVGITDRAALSILRMLEEDDIIARRKEGRRNVYTVDLEALMAHRSQGPYSIEQIAGALFALAGRTPPGYVLPPGFELAQAAAGSDGTLSNAQPGST